MDHDGIAVRLIPFNSFIFASTRHNSRRIPSHHNFDFELSRWCHCHPKQEWHACDSSVDLSYVMSDVQLVQLFFTEEDAPLKTKMTPSRVVVERQAIPSKMVPIPEDMLNIVKLLVLGGCICGHFLQFQELWNGSWTLRLWERSWWVPATPMVLIRGQSCQQGFCRWPCSNRDLQVCCSRYGFPGP